MSGHHLQLRYHHFIPYSFQFPGVAKNTAHRSRWGCKQTRIGWSRCSDTGFSLQRLSFVLFIREIKKGID
jgi:hypothetical protein